MADQIEKNDKVMAAMQSIENRVRWIYNQGYIAGVGAAKAKGFHCDEERGVMLMKEQFEEVLDSWLTIINMGKNAVDMVQTVPLVDLRSMLDTAQRFASRNIYNRMINPKGEQHEP